MKILLKEWKFVESEEESDKTIKTLNVEKLEAFMHLDNFLNIMEEYDPDGSRISKVCRAINQESLSKEEKAEY